jgi:hypothetical protein
VELDSPRGQHWPQRVSLWLRLASPPVVAI